MCGALTGTDICGLPRTVAECGPCLGPTTCSGDGTCTPLCTAPPSSGVGTVIGSPPADVQDIFGGATMDAGTILDRADASCSGATTYALLDLNISGYTTTAFTSPFSTGEQNIRISGDGLSVIGVTTAGNSFGEIKRSARYIADFSNVDTTAYSALTVTSGAVNYPVVSADGHFFFYVQSGTAADGAYIAKRDDPHGAFSAGTLLGFPNGYFVTGISADDLSLFVQNGYTVSVYTRNSPWVPFPTTSTVVVPGFRTQPLLLCTTLIGTCHGGCVNEDICTF